MVKLIREQKGNSVFSKREWFELGENTAIVAYGKEKCGIILFDKNHKDVTNFVVKKLYSNAQDNVQLIPSIDCNLIECNMSELMDFLSKIQSILYQYPH